jgi:putative spermidine/putrescine transport system substrate-binding protein
MKISRREFAAGLGGAAVAGALPLAHAQAARTVTSAVYPTSWDDAFRTHVAPVLKQKHNINLALDPLFAVDQIAKARASRNVAPFDVFLLDPGPRVAGIDMKLFKKFDPTKLSNYSKLPKGFADEHGVAASVQVVGIAYNPKKLQKPKSWNDLFKPEYVSRLGLTGFQTTYGTVSLIEIAKANGGSETDVEPAFAKIKEALPKVAAIAPPNAMSGLFQQGEIDLMYTNTYTVTTLRSRGVDIDFAVPETGGISFPTTMHLAVNSKAEDEAYAYIDTVIDAAVQESLSKDPFYFVPVNSDTPLGEGVPMKNLSEISNFVSHDWTKINPLRPKWIERFNREAAR